MSNNIKFLIACPQRASGGAERVATLLANELVNKNHEVIFLQYFENNQDYLLDSKVKLKIIDIKSKFLIVRKIKRVVQTVTFIRKSNVDYVIPFLGKMVDICFWATRFKKETIFISTIRNNPRVSPDSFIKRLWRNIICFFSNAIFVQNLDQKNYFPKILERKIFIVANPIDSNISNVNYVLNGKVKRIVTAGRLTEQKNQKLLIKSFNEISKFYPDIELNIYGDGNLKNELLNLSKNNPKISLCGRVKCIQDYYRKGDIFVLSSNFEGMPNALMEAMAMGIPSISTNCPTGPSDIIDSYQNGILVSCDRQDELIDAIKYMIENPNKAEKMGIKGKDTIISSYNISEITDKFINECERIRKY